MLCAIRLLAVERTFFAGNSIVAERVAETWRTVTINDLKSGGAFLAIRMAVI